VKEIHK